MADDNAYAVIGKLKLQEVDGANTLQMGFYNGLPFAVQKDLTEDDLCIIFFPDSQLSEEYAIANDCVQRIDENGNRAGGFFGKNRKVRSVKFMKGKIHSVGYVAKIDTLAFTGFDLSKLNEGANVTELNGIPIANKFVNEATRRAARNKDKSLSQEREMLGLKMHKDTGQYYKHKDNFQDRDLVTWTEKLDGTSVRFGEVYNERKFNWAQRLLNKLTPLQKYDKKFVTGTRRTLLNDSKKTFYDTGNQPNIYREMTEPYKDKLHQGEAIYAEIVGWLDKTRPLFERGGVKFTYGCVPGERKLFVYRITWTLPDGTEMDLPWEHVKERCAELGLHSVPELYASYYYDDADYLSWDDDNTPIDILPDHIESMTNQFTEGKSTLDHSHIREGCVIRVDRGRDTFFYKSKSEEYYGLEDAFKNDDSNVDIEEAQG